MLQSTTVPWTRRWFGVHLRLLASESSHDPVAWQCQPSLQRGNHAHAMPRKSFAIFNSRHRYHGRFRLSLFKINQATVHLHGREKPVMISRFRRHPVGAWDGFRVEDEKGISPEVKREPGNLLESSGQSLTQVPAIGRSGWR